MKLKAYLISDCVAFTAVVLALNACYLAGISPVLQGWTLYELFAATTAMCLLMYLTDKLPVESPLLVIALHLADVAVVVLGLGCGVFHWFPWEPFYVLTSCIIFSVIYLLIHGITLFRNNRISRKINRELHAQALQHGEDDHG